MQTYTHIKETYAYVNKCKTAIYIHEYIHVFKHTYIHSESVTDRKSEPQKAAVARIVSITVSENTPRTSGKVSRKRQIACLLNTGASVKD